MIAFYLAIATGWEVLGREGGISKQQLLPLADLFSPYRASRKDVEHYFSTFKVVCAYFS